MKFNKIIKSLTAVIVIVSVGFSDDKTNDNLKRIDAFKHKLDGAIVKHLGVNGKLPEFNVSLVIKNKSICQIVQTGYDDKDEYIYQPSIEYSVLKYGKTFTNYHFVPTSIARVCRDLAHNTEFSRSVICEFKFKMQCLGISKKLRVIADYNGDTDELLRWRFLDDKKNEQVFSSNHNATLNISINPDSKEFSFSF